MGLSGAKQPYEKGSRRVPMHGKRSCISHFGEMLDISPQKLLRADDQVMECGCPRTSRPASTRSTCTRSRRPVFAEEFDRVENGVRLGGEIAFEDGFTLGGVDVHEHAFCVLTDARVEWVRLVVVRHPGLLVRRRGFLIPHRGCRLFDAGWKFHV